jgi:hypothetical protein
LADDPSSSLLLLADDPSSSLLLLADDPSSACAGSLDEPLSTKGSFSVFSTEFVLLVSLSAELVFGVED